MADEWDQDGYYKQQVSIPFKWEIRPGVPKVLSQEPEHRNEQTKEEEDHHRKAFPETPTKLAPPPARIYFQTQMEPRSRSILSAPKALSDRYASYISSTLAQPASVYPGGCLPSSPLLAKSRNEKKKINKHKYKLRVQPESQPELLPDFETWSPGSVPSRKFKSPFRTSPFSSAFSSHRSSPRPAVNDVAWASFGLF